MKKFFAFCVLGVIATAPLVEAADSLPKRKAAPQTFEALWSGYDPTAEPLEVKVVREWEDAGLVFRYLLYTVGTFKGTKARMAAFYAFPKGAKNLPGLLHMHGGGQRASLRTLHIYARRGYGVVSINWGGKTMERAKPADPNTDWGAVDPTQNNVHWYSSLLPSPKTIDPFESPRNNNWFLLTIGGRRAITFLQTQPEVDPQRIGVLGHSMGGRLTGLVTGADERVKVASPSVGGSGFLQYDRWGLPGSGRRVKGDINLFRETIAGQAYLARVNCPYLFLSSTNDFNAPLDCVAQGMTLIPHPDKRVTQAPHLNHRFTPEADMSRRLWFDSHLQKRLTFPKAPKIDLTLKNADGIPTVRVTPDRSRPIAKVNVYYGYERDARNRYWADAQARQQDGVWTARCPVFDLGEPLFVLANIHYTLTDAERREGDPEHFLISATARAYPDALKDARVKATEKQRRQIDDFSRGYHDWYQLAWGNKHHWHASTRKLADPRWEGPRGAKLAFAVTTDQAGETLGVQINTNSWRGYAGRRPKVFVALVNLEKAGTNNLALSPKDFIDANGESLPDWHGITELGLRPGNRSYEAMVKKHKGNEPDTAKPGPWKGKVPTFANLRWEGGEPVRRTKPFLPVGAPPPSNAGHESKEFQEAIDKSIELEKQDAAK